MTPDQWIQLVMGMATLVNSLILWPIVRALKKNDRTHDVRLSKLEKRKRGRR
jgi:hypothetical protein